MPSSISPSLELLGAGARWAARDGTSALYINWRDNYDAHHLTDGASWSPWRSQETMDQRKAAVTNILEQQGFDVECSADVPETLSNYDLVVFEALYAVEPRHSPLIREYLNDGGSVVIFAGVPSYLVVYCKDFWPGSASTDLSSLQDWFGAHYLPNTGGSARLALDSPFGTTLLSRDQLFYTDSHGCHGLTSLSSNSNVIARWDEGPVFAFTHEYGKGRVYYQAIFETQPSSDSSPSPDSSDISTSISISTYAPSSFAGFAVDVSGVLSDADGNALYNEPVLLYYTFPGYESWIPVTSGITDEFGEYGIKWIPTATGSFTLKTEWKGNATHSGSSDIVSLSTVPYESDIVFSVESNSTVSAFAFNSTSLELSFSVSGVDGSTGYVELTVAKSIVADVADISVFLDGMELAYSASSSGDSWLLVFAYAHSTHDVAVSFGVQSEPAPTELSLTALITVAATGASVLVVSVGLFVYFKKHHATKRTLQGNSAVA